jgi:hypothetical protein
MVTKLRFPEILNISEFAKNLMVSQGLNSIELVSYIYRALQMVIGFKGI